MDKDTLFLKHNINIFTIASMRICIHHRFIVVHLWTLCSHLLEVQKRTQYVCTSQRSHTHLNVD